MSKSSNQYMHGRSESERQRLAVLNELLNERSLAALRLEKGSKVLDVGCGQAQFTAAMASAVGAEGSVLGIEADEGQLSRHRSSAGMENLELRSGDVRELPLKDDEWGTFDVVHARFVLEHLPEPAAAVEHWAKALRPGGRMVLEDDDHDLLRLWPEVEAFEELWSGLVDAWDVSGNDPFVGRRLTRLMHRAGLKPAANQLLFFGSCAGSPSFDAMCANFRSVIVAARDQIAEVTGAGESEIDAGLEEFSKWAGRADSALWYASCWAEAVKPSKRRRRKKARRRRKSDGSGDDAAVQSGPTSEDQPASEPEVQAPPEGPAADLGGGGEERVARENGEARESAGSRDDLSQTADGPGLETDGTGMPERSSRPERSSTGRRRRQRRESDSGDEESTRLRWRGRRPLAQVSRKSASVGFMPTNRKTSRTSPRGGASARRKIGISQNTVEDSGRTFDSLGLPAKLVASLLDLGFEHPTEIQASVIPEATSGRDVIGLAQTGSGKTAAFCLPLAAKIVPAGVVRAVILCPTREIAQQTLVFLEALGEDIGLRSALLIGGVRIEPQIERLRRGVDIVVATPGRLLDHMRRRTIDPRKVDDLVLDEADHMLDLGFLPQIREVLEGLPEDRRTLMFSATMPAPIERLAQRFMTDPVRIDLLPDIGAAEGIDHRLYLVEDEDRKPCLQSLVNEEEGSVLVFMRRKMDADWACRQLQIEGHPVERIHSGLSQGQRTRALEGFRSGEHRVLVATDVAARGIDIPRIEHIINFDPPQTVDDYIHRAGRTARGALQGTVSTIGTWQAKHMVMLIESTLGQTLRRCVAPGVEPWEEASPPGPKRRRLR